MRRKILILIAFMSLAVFSFAAGRNFTLVIDAGHGGHDAGARGAFSLEKNINLKVALAFGSYVERLCPDVKVVYTRKTDVFVPLHERARIANKNKADVFISIHTNSLPKGRVARGIETYTMGMRRSDEKLSAAKRENSVIMIEKDYQQHYEGYDPNSPESAIMFEFMHDKNMAESVELAKLVQGNICTTSGRANKGVKQDVFLVLRETSMPACLVELGFISTPDEEQYLNRPKSIDDLARGIYLAFVKYKNAHGGSFTVPFVPSPNTDEEVKAADTAGKDNGTDGSKDVAADEDRGAKNETKGGAGRQGGRDELAVRVDKNKDVPVFKVQILASDKPLRSGSPMLKGVKDADCYHEGAYYKYTCGASANYNEIYRLRKTLLEKFPQAFIIAFKNGQKMNVTEAIREFKSNRK